MIEENFNTIKHLAIMMDGNRRWATERGLPKLMGHSEGTKTLKKIIRAVKERQIPYLTVWALSTENLKNRSQEELNHLFFLFEKVADEFAELNKENIRINTIGDLSKLPEKTQGKLNEIKELTKSNTGLTVNLAINYGGRDDLIRAVKKIVAAKYEVQDIDEQIISDHLDTAQQPDIDLMIRTGGHQRFSGYLIWQSIYAELYFTSVTWPAFTDEELDKSIDWFKLQQRNRGK